MKSLVFSLSVIILLVGINSKVSAGDKHILCDGYAKSAVAQQTENTSRGCGLSGPEWSSNYDYHYKWCMNIQDSILDILNRGRDERRWAMQKTSTCVGYNSGEFNCHAYAITAVSSNDDNMFYRCGFTGGMWSSDYSHHYNWCNQGDNYHKFAAKGSLERKNMVEKCTGCWNYSYTAVEQNDMNVDKNCGFKGPEWNPSFNYHYEWCVKGDNLKNFADNGRNERWDKLKSCK